jgi:LuxR family maltose regulon positive regulatory protein
MMSNSYNSDLCRNLELLATKIEFPKLNGLIIPRRNCIDLLDQGLNKQVTLIAAPTGYGKTTLLTEWLQKQANSAQLQVWISLDAYDNSEMQFWSYIVVAFQKRYPKFRFNLQQFMKSCLEIDEYTYLNQFINEISTIPESFHLILDDYHLITNEKIHSGIDYLITHQPKNLHITFSSRTSLPISISRLRAQDQITEVTCTDLAFTLEETRAFLIDSRGLIISPSQVQSLYAATEGWIAGLQLAAHSMRDRSTIHLPSGKIAENNPQILEYLSEEVINKQDSQIKDFLLKTSILSEFTAPLCDTLLEISCSREIIKQIEQLNLFIKPIDQSHHWYRYHPLFSHYMSILLEKLYPETIPFLHRKACKWLQMNNYPDKAIPHTFACGNLDCAARILDNWSMQAITKLDLTNLIHWSSYISDDLFNKYPNLGINYALANQILLRHKWVEPIINRAETALGNLHDDSEQSKWKISVIRVIQQSRGDDYEGTNAQLESLLNYSLPNDTYYHGLINHSIAETDETTGEFSSAVKAYERGSVFAISHNLYTEYVFSQCAMARVRMLQGHLSEAKQLFEQAEEYAIQHDLALCVFTLARTGIMEIGIERNNLDIDRASILKIADQFIKLGMSPILPHYLFIISYRFLRYFQFIHDKQRSAYFLQFICNNISKDNYSLVFPEIANLQFLIESGTTDLDKSLNLLLDMANPRPIMVIANKILQARILLTKKRPEEAASILNELAEKIFDTDCGKFLLLFFILNAIDAKMLNQDELSLDWMDKALSMAEPEGYIRLFQEQGIEIEHLLEKKALTEQNKMLDGQILNENEFLQRVIAAFQPRSEEFIQNNELGLVKKSQSIKRLTQREIEVLEIMASGKSIKEMAIILMISMSTAKTYVKRIYKKLGIHSKNAMLEYAQEYKLIQSHKNYP